MARGKKIYRLLIEHIISRFLKPNLKLKSEDFESIGDILDLPISALNEVETVEAAQLYDIFKCKTIGDLAKLDPLDPIQLLLPNEKMFSDIEKYEKKVQQITKKTMESFEDFEKLRNHIAIANMIKRAWSKRAAYTKKKETKFICIGLDNAGKTAILTGLGGKLGIAQLGKLKPTKRIERKKISTETMDLFIWDFGGQLEYRLEYLKKPEAFFVGTDMLLYVIDMQDPERYNESFEYLIEILDVIKLLGENPYILAFMHKSDPDILEDADFQLNTEYVADKLNYHLSNYEFEYDIYTTSIYNFFTSEPKFSMFIKETLSDKESLNNPVIRKIEGLGDILDSTLNTIISLANSLGEQITNLSRRMDMLEHRFTQAIPVSNQMISATAATARSSDGHNHSKTIPNPTISRQIIYTTRPIPGFHDPSQSNTPGNPKEDTRALIMSELRSLFQAKRNLDNSTHLNKLGSIGKKFEKTKST